MPLPSYGMVARFAMMKSEEAVRARGLKPQLHQLLLALKALPGGRKATIGELAERLQLLSLIPAPAFLLVETSI